MEICITDRLAWKMRGAIGDVLSAQVYDRDRLNMWILLTLSRPPFDTQLLFVDLGAGKESKHHRVTTTTEDGRTSSSVISEQAITYYSQVLGRRLTLAQNLKDAPTIMHRLFEALTRCASPNSTWQGTNVRRAERCPASSDSADPSFLAVAAALAEQCAKLGSRYTPISQRRRAEFGPFWLIVDLGSAEMPEELSLFDVLDALPKPLQRPCLDASRLDHLLSRAIKSLNERYMLLRACGLAPSLWLERETPSIGDLRDMKQLRQQARGILQQGQAAANVEAFRRAFDRLKGDRRKLAGCATFDQLVATEHGMTLIGLPHLSLDQPFDSDDDDDPLVEHLPAVTEGSLAEAVASRRDAQDWVEALIAARPDWFSPVMRWLFLALLRDGRPLFDGCGEQGVLGDAAFKQLIEQDEALASLSEEALAERLMADAKALADRGRRLCKDDPTENRGGGLAHAECRS